jgi:hypothetical protein
MGRIIVLCLAAVDIQSSLNRWNGTTGDLDDCCERKRMNRRNFLKGSVLTGTGIVFSGVRSWAKTVDAHIEIVLDEASGFISPNIYGQFTEHIGGVIYDGVWVG